MVNRTLLQENFEFIGIEVGPEILDVCEELCILHHVEEEEFVNMWIAYSISKLNSQPPTSKFLYQMAQEQLEKSNKKPKAKTIENSPALVIYNPETSNTYNCDDAILDSYSSGPQRKNGPDDCLKTPERRRKNTTEFSPASFSATALTPSSRYENRTNAGSVATSFGDGMDDKLNWHGTRRKELIKVLSLMESLTNFPSCGHIGQYLLERLNLIDKQIINQIPSEFMNYRIITGRITSTSGNERMTLEKVNLDTQNEKGDFILEPLIFNDFDELAIFPGQIAAVLSEFGKGKDTKIVADKIFTHALPPLRTFTNENELQIVISCGPFTQSDTLNYQPLADLATYVADHKPDVVILIGPIVDSNHPLVEDCSLAETFNSFFEKLMARFMERLQGTSTQVILVSSQRDVNSPCVYPTPPYHLKNFKNLHLFSDPSKFTIGNIIVAVTSIDILKHLSKFEFYRASQPSRDRLGRLARHLLSQQNIYPLYPPDPELSLDLGLHSKCCYFELMPHLLIVPSDLKYFIKDIDGCIVINPERLAKGLIGGTFARLQINPKTSPESKESFCKFVQAQIIHI